MDIWVENGIIMVDVGDGPQPLQAVFPSLAALLAPFAARLTNEALDALTPVLNDPTLALAGDDQIRAAIETVLQPEGGAGVDFAQDARVFTAVGDVPERTAAAQGQDDVPPRPEGHIGEWPIFQRRNDGLLLKDINDNTILDGRAMEAAIDRAEAKVTKREAAEAKAEAEAAKLDTGAFFNTREQATTAAGPGQAVEQRGPNNFVLREAPREERLRNFDDAIFEAFQAGDFDLSQAIDDFRDRIDAGDTSQDFFQAAAQRASELATTAEDFNRIFRAMTGFADPPTEPTAPQDVTAQLAAQAQAASRLPGFPAETQGEQPIRSFADNPNVFRKAEGFAQNPTASGPPGAFNLAGLGFNADPASFGFLPDNPARGTFSTLPGFAQGEFAARQTVRQLDSEAEQAVEEQRRRRERQQRLQTPSRASFN